VIIDSSALIAIVFEEKEADLFIDTLAAAESVTMSAATYLEASIRVDAAKDPIASRVYDKLIATFGISIEDVSVEQAMIAREAYRDFGRGSGHPAKLNFGDCFTYALAKVTGSPLLFQGDDFSHTDITPAIDPGQSRT
jgi:ribonuclease VapC